MRALVIVVIAGLMAACAADPARVQAVAEQESSRLEKASKPLSSFAEFELRPMTFTDGIMQEEGKLEEAAAKLNEALAINQDYALAHSALAVVLQRLGRHEDAIAHAQRRESSSSTRR